VAFSLLAAFYCATVLAFSLALARRHGFGHLLAGPLVFLTIHAGLGAGFLAEALRWRRRKTTEQGQVQKPRPNGELPPTLVETSGRWPGPVLLLVRGCS